MQEGGNVAILFYSLMGRSGSNSWTLIASRRLTSRRLEMVIFEKAGGLERIFIILYYNYIIETIIETIYIIIIETI